MTESRTALCEAQEEAQVVLRRGHPDEPPLGEEGLEGDWNLKRRSQEAMVRTR